MVFRKESREDSFQRQISALRQQLGNDDEDETYFDDDNGSQPRMDDSSPHPSGPIDTQPSPPAGYAPSTEDATVGIIAASSVWDGTLRSQGSLRVFGQVEGELVADEEIFVAEGARVSARLSAQRIIVAGMVQGTIECHGRLEVLATGRVSGDVTSPSLVVHEGATVEGDLKMRSPQGAVR